MKKPNPVIQLDTITFEEIVSLAGGALLSQLISQHFPSTATFEDIIGHGEFEVSREQISAYFRALIPGAVKASAELFVFGTPITFKEIGIQAMLIFSTSIAQKAAVNDFVSVSIKPQIYLTTQAEFEAGEESREESQRMYILNQEQIEEAKKLMYLHSKSSVEYYKVQGTEKLQ